MGEKDFWIVIAAGVATVLLLGFVLAGVASAGDAGLEERTWVVRELDGNAPLSGTVLTARFEGGAVSGDAGCNVFSGGYATDGDALSIGPLATTLAACAAPEGVMEQEGAYLAALESADAYAQSGNGLVLTRGETEVVRFEALPADIDSVWGAVSITSADGTVAPDPAAPITAAVVGSRTGPVVVGSGGCNRYQGALFAEGDVISIGPVSSTFMACPEPIGSTEQAYFAALDAAVRFTQDGDTLVLYDVEGREVVRFGRILEN